LKRVIKTVWDAALVVLLLTVFLMIVVGALTK